MDETTCIVDVAKFFLKFTTAESCGKCALPRGNDAHARNTGAITRDRRRCRPGGAGTAGPGLQEHCPVRAGADGSQPGFEHPALLPRGIRGAYSAAQMPCRSMQRSDSVSNRCGAVCRLSGVCMVCPTGAIRGEKKAPHKIEVLDCIKCGACMEKCRFDAIIRSVGGTFMSQVTLTIDGKKLRLKPGQPF